MGKYKKLNISETISFWINYVLIMFILTFIFLPDFSKIKNLEEVPNSLIIYILIAIIFLIHKIKVRRYSVVNKTLTNNQFKAVSESHNLISNEEMKLSEPNLYISINNTLWQWEGIQFTVKKVNDKIYINTMPTPSFRSNPFSYIFAKNNKTLYLSLIDDILQGKDIVKHANQKVKREELKFWNQGEWGLLSILKRIFMYSVFIISLYFSFYIFENTKVIIVLILLIISGYFIFWDIFILLIKRNFKH